jgi:cation diffusion facilitator CzcD-associated flavoprotein CzcO
MELDVWTSATVMSVIPGTKGKKWTVTVQRADKKERIFEVNHVVFALGFGSGMGRIPDIPGQVRSIHACTILRLMSNTYIGRLQGADIAFQ